MKAALFLALFLVALYVRDSLETSSNCTSDEDDSSVSSNSSDTSESSDSSDTSESSDSSDSSDTSESSDSSSLDSDEFANLTAIERGLIGLEEVATETAQLLGLNETTLAALIDVLSTTFTEFLEPFIADDTTNATSTESAGADD